MFLLFLPILLIILTVIGGLIEKGIKNYNKSKEAYYWNQSLIYRFKIGDLIYFNPNLTFHNENVYIISDIHYYSNYKLFSTKPSAALYTLKKIPFKNGDRKLKISESKYFSKIISPEVIEIINLLYQ